MYITNVELIPHPAASSGAVRRVSASCRRLPEPGVLLLSYRLEGDLGRLCTPAPAPPDRADELWRHTCLEAFVQRAGRDGYFEFNFAPSTQWAAYSFEGYRAGMVPLASVPEPQIAVQAGTGVLALTARIVLPVQDALPWRIGLTAVIEDSDNQLSWWALRHTGDKPDFHLAPSFVFEC